MYDLLAARRSALAPLSDGNLGMEFLGFLSSATSSSLEYHAALVLTWLATLHTAALHSFALAIAFASRSSILLMVISLLVEIGVRVTVMLSYVAWCLIFTVSLTTTAFA